MILQDFLKFILLISTVRYGFHHVCLLTRCLQTFCICCLFSLPISFQLRQLSIYRLVGKPTDRPFVWAFHSLLQCVILLYGILYLPIPQYARNQRAAPQVRPDVVASREGREGRKKRDRQILGLLERQNFKLGHFYTMYGRHTVWSGNICIYKIIFYQKCLMTDMTYFVT